MDAVVCGGAEPSEILVFCATPAAAQNLKVRLQALGPQTKGIEVTTPRAFFLELLSTEEAFAATGRKARLFLPFEYDFFLEDLKTSGISPKRLRKILPFFYKGLSELADDGAWLATNEERELFSLIKDCLSFTGAILEPELANLAVNYLRSNERARESAQRTFVFVDDFELLSRASQYASCLVAKECLFLSANPDAALEVYESYPSGDGIDEFIEANPDALQTRLSQSYSCSSAGRASCALRQENGVDVSGTNYPKSEEESGFQLIEGANPKDEVAGIVEVVSRLLRDGLPAHDILIAAPHPAWMQYLVRQLTARDIPAEVLPDARILKADIHSTDKSFNARFLTLLSLIADPTDAVAWRSWCGFGDHLTHSNGMRALRRIGQIQGKTLDVVLETSDLQLDNSEGLDAIATTQRIMKARDEARVLIEQLKSLQGQDLLEALAHEFAGPGAQVPEIIRSLASDCENDGENKSAQSMMSCIRARLELPVYCDTNVVRVVSFKNVAGMSPRSLFLAGFMNGFFPQHDYFDGTALTVDQREKRRTQDLSRIASLVAKASDTLVVSYSKELDVTDAQRLGLVINRIAFESNKRVAKTEPSIFLKFISA
jgi:hypothetical protein